ncbi:DUF2637 domain-containing protein [Streptomyces niveus]|uniref:DUF2637 domain-containing protein n=1 Tax=Streptomyces niveus TaxID=193462 RepID=UPI0036520A2D
MNRPQRLIVGVVASGSVLIAGIGFAGSYAAVRDLAVRKGFGEFAVWFPIGIDAGILVLLALDLLLTWLRMPFPLLRPAAWLLTGATIAFNGAVAWPDPLGVGMHAVTPVLFVVTVEAARHAVGRLASITAGRHMEPVRLVRWLLSPAPTFKMWRRMQLWELRSYQTVIGFEQDRLIYRARLRARFGRGWRRTAPVTELLPLRLVRYGVPLKEAIAAAAALNTPQPQNPVVGGELDAHVAAALAMLSSRGEDQRGTPAGNIVNAVTSHRESPTGSGVKRSAESSVNAAAGREPRTVKSAAGADVNSHPPRFHTVMDPVNDSWKPDSRSGVNSAAGAAGSHLTGFTATVKHGGVNRVSTMNLLLTGTVNEFTVPVKPSGFTRESGAVNLSGGCVNRPRTGGVNRSSDRESDSVNSATADVKRQLDETVNAHVGTRETADVNGRDDGVNEVAVNSRPAQRAGAAEEPAGGPGDAAGTASVHEEERASAAAGWARAKAAEPGLLQKDFAMRLGRSGPWLTKALKEAAGKARDTSHE